MNHAHTTASSLFEVQRRGSVLIITPTADLDELAFEQIDAGGKKILDALNDATLRNVVIDFAHTDVFGSSALGLFLKLWKRVRSKGATMVFCNVSEHEKEILELVELNQLWPSCSTRAQALALLGLDSSSGDEARQNSTAPVFVADRSRPADERSPCARIMVPLDGSPFAEQALPLAVAIARKSGGRLDLARVHVLYALREPAAAWAPYDPREEQEVRQAEQSYLREVAARIQGCRNVTCSLVHGLTADGILEHARQSGADLVVMTTHGRGPLGRFWLGSVADELVRRSPVPLLLVRPQEAAASPPSEPAIGHILVPLDGSELGEQALEHAVALAKLATARLTLLSVVEPILLPGHDPTGFDMTRWDQTRMDRGRTEAQRYLDRVIDRLASERVRIQTDIIVGQKAATTIIEEAAVRGADIIAMATHCRGRLKRALLGSVADKVLRGSTLPILLCREPPAIKAR